MRISKNRCTQDNGTRRLVKKFEWVSFMCGQVYACVFVEDDVQVERCNVQPGVRRLCAVPMTSLLVSISSIFTQCFA